MKGSRRKVLKAGAALAAAASLPRAAFAQAGPVKVGMSMRQTGSLGAGGQAALLALRMWVEDVNKKGGLLNRQVELIAYDDQTNPANGRGLLLMGISSFWETAKVGRVGWFNIALGNEAPGGPVVFFRPGQKAGAKT